MCVRAMASVPELLGLGKHAGTGSALGLMSDVEKACLCLRWTE